MRIAVILFHSLIPHVCDPLAGPASESPLLHLAFEQHVADSANADLSVVVNLRPLAVVLDAEWLSAWLAFFTTPYHMQLGDTDTAFVARVQDGG